MASEWIKARTGLRSDRRDSEEMVKRRENLEWNKELR